MRKTSKLMLVLMLSLYGCVQILSVYCYKPFNEYLLKVDHVDDELYEILGEEGFEVVRVLGEIDVLLVEYHGVKAEDVLQKLDKTANVEYVERNSMVGLPPYESVVIEKMDVEIQGAPDDDLWDSDPYTLLGQWNMRVIDALEGWETQMGEPEVLVAVLDTGVRDTHWELRERFVPLGYNWMDDNADTSDDNGHGTHVAGIICAETNNSYGMAGLASVSIMAEKVLDSSGTGSWADAASAIIHATDMGADVITMSFSSYESSPTAELAVSYAYEAGCILVASTGNDGVDTPTYPAAYDKVVSVGATYGEPDLVAPYSNYGNWVELTAPGGMDEDGDGGPEVGEHWIISTWHLYDECFAYSYGTSMAAPHVAGQVALYLSEYGEVGNSEVRMVLWESAEDKGDPGKDDYYGYGRIDIDDSLRIGAPVGGIGTEIRPDMDRTTLNQMKSSHMTIITRILITALALIAVNAYMRRT